MGEVAHQGRTVLFVTHNMNAIRSLCTTAILLQNGRVNRTGSAVEVVEHYYRLATPAANQAQRVPTDGSGFLSWKCAGASSINSNAASNDSPLDIVAQFRLDRAMPIAFGLVISNDEDVKIVIHQ